MLTIEITGDRGDGKTTTALLLASFLRSFGNEVEYVGRKTEGETGPFVDDDVPTPEGWSRKSLEQALSEKKKIVIRDLCER